MSGPRWLLVETFGGTPSVIGVGSRTPAFLPIDEVIKHPETLQIASDVIVELMGSVHAVDRTVGVRRVLARPLVTFEGRMHGVHLWIGREDDPIPDRPIAGAWLFNTTAAKASGSEDLFDLYAVPDEHRRTEIAMAGAFTRLFAGSDQGDAIAKIINSQPGTEHQAVWTVTRDDGAQRAAHFSCRMYRECAADSEDDEVILRGITHDLGPADAIAKAPSPVVLEYKVIEASAEPGEYRALLHPANLALIRWMHEPMPGIAWENNTGEPTPAIHPEDVPRTRELIRTLTAPPGRAEGYVRVRGLDGSWVRLAARGGLMPLDTTTTAMLVTVRRADKD